MAVVGLAVAGYRPAALLVAAAVVLGFVERRWGVRRWPLARRGWRTDVAYVLGTPLFGAVATVAAVAVGAVSLAWLPGLALRPIVTDLPGWARVVLAAVLVDLGFYWAHRLSHRIPALWRFHVIHHSSTHIDWLSGLRAHPVGLAVHGPYLAFLFAADFEPMEIGGVLGVVRGVTAVWSHVNVRWSMRPLHKVLATPAFHHWHHANERRAWDRNFAGVLPLWDLLFGTYHLPPDRRPSVCGVDDPVPEGLLAQLTAPFRRRPVAAGPVG